MTIAVGGKLNSKSNQKVILFSSWLYDNLKTGFRNEPYGSLLTYSICSRDNDMNCNVDIFISRLREILCCIFIQETTRLKSLTSVKYLL